MQLMPHTTATNFQRNFNKVTKKAEDMGEPLMIISNSVLRGVYMPYDVYVRDHPVAGKIVAQKKKIGMDAIFNTWTKKEADEFNKNIEEAFEQIHPDDWQ